MSSLPQTNNRVNNARGSGCRALDKLIESSKPVKNGDSKREPLKWIPYHYSDPIQYSADLGIHFAESNSSEEEPPQLMMLLLMGTIEECTEDYIKEFAWKYSLPTHTYEVSPNSSQFKRYTTLLIRRNEMIAGFTKYQDNYYMVAKRDFRYCYTQYGFCSACGVLRCSPVWCICGHKELTNQWTTYDEKLDEFIRESQNRSTTANEVYLEWIPFALTESGPVDYTSDSDNSNDVDSTSINEGIDTNSLPGYLRCGLPTFGYIELIPLDTADDLFYRKLCDEHPDILKTDVWVTIGFTYHPLWQKYALIKTMPWNSYNVGLCLVCTDYLESGIDSFCFKCKAPRSLSWTTGYESLDSFIVKSWSNTSAEVDGYLRCIEFSQLTNMQKSPSALDHGCTHTADWIEPTIDGNKTRSVILKLIVDGENASSFDFNQLTEDYPRILTPDNIRIIGIAKQPSNGDCYLVFHNSVYSILDNVVQMAKSILRDSFSWIDYDEFDDITEVGSGGYGTVFTAKTKNPSMFQLYDDQTSVALKRLNDFDQMLESIVSEVKGYVCYSSYDSIKTYGFTQHPETKEYLIVMKYAENGNLYSYLDQNINPLTWRMKADLVESIAEKLYIIHKRNSIHCNLHGGNILLDNDDNDFLDENTSISAVYISDLGLCQPLKQSKSGSTIYGVLPYIAPEVFSTHEFTPKSDIYAFGIIMHQIASGEPPFSNREFDLQLVKDICNGLRPTMPDLIPEPYKSLAEKCCNADPDKRPNALQLVEYIKQNIRKQIWASRDDTFDDDDLWNAIYYCEDIQPITNIEKETKYSSKPLPTGDLPEPRNRTTRV